jgi:hypothetical protein
MEFFETPAFTRYLPEYLDDEGYRTLQKELARKPEAGDLIPGTEGFRKVRWADRRLRQRSKQKAKPVRRPGGHGNGKEKDFCGID